MNEYEKALNETEEEEKQIISDNERQAILAYATLRGINAEFVNKASVAGKLLLEEANKYNRLSSYLKKAYDQVDTLKINVTEFDKYLKNVADINFNATASELSDILNGRNISINKSQYDDLIQTVFKNDSINNNIIRSKLKLQQEVKQAIASEEGIQKFNKRVKDVLESTTNQNNTIIRTQTTKTMNNSRLLGMEKANEKVDDEILKDWVSRRDEKVRNSHVEMDNLDPIPLDEPFPNGLMYPGEAGGPAAEVINCRCEIEHVINS